MSDCILKLIPKKYYHVPHEPLHILAKEFANKSFPKADSVDILVYDEVVFVDSGENFKSVGCPICGTELNIDCWQELMSIASESNFINLVVLLTCCNQSSSLNELRYDPPVGFSKFILQITNPQESINTELLKEFEKILGCQLRIVNAYY